MALDPTVQTLVDQINQAAAEAPPIDDQTVAERRASYTALSQLAGEGPEVARLYHAAADGVPVRVYQPTPEGGKGICIYYHGGGFVIGDLDTHDQVCRQLCLQSGAIIVSVDYRLAPENPYPAAIEDAWTALNWAVDNAHHLVNAEIATGVTDPAPDGTTPKITVCGDSAGGNLAAVVALMARDAGLDLAAQILVYPWVTDHRSGYQSMTENGEGYVLTAEGVDWFSRLYLPGGSDPSDWQASPIAAESHQGVAPALVITAEYDPLRDEGIAYATKLTDAGVEVTHTPYAGMVHVFFQLGPIIPRGADAITQVAETIAKASGR